MKNQSIKGELHQMIEQTEDENILHAAYQLLEGKETLHQTTGESLTQQQLEAHIDEAEDDIKAGRIYSQAQIKSFFHGK